LLLNPHRISNGKHCTPFKPGVTILSFICLLYTHTGFPMGNLALPQTLLSKLKPSQPGSPWLPSSGVDL